MEAARGRAGEGWVPEMFSVLTMDLTLLGKPDLFHSSQPTREVGRRSSIFIKGETEAQRNSDKERHQSRGTKTVGCWVEIQMQSCLSLGPPLLNTLPGWWPKTKPFKDSWS